MRDILFKTDDGIFSYRVAGICVQDGYVLLQNTTNDPAYAFPGGHVTLGETNEQTLVREFYEEIGAQINVGALRSVAEIFFPWGGQMCTQLCLYYDVEIAPGSIPKRGSFSARERLEGREFEILFHWVPIDSLDNAEIYPPETRELLREKNGCVTHFVYREE